MVERKEYNQLVGRVGEEYYFLDDTFRYSDEFHGATGTILHPISHAEAKERRDGFDEDGELWRMAVEAENTTMGLNEWREYVLIADGDDAVFDLSYYSLGQKLLDIIDPDREIYELVEAIGGGRIFPRYDWDEVYAPELLGVIRRAETTPQHIY